MPDDVQLPDVKTDSFETAGLAPPGPAKVRLEEWKYQKPGAGGGSGAYRGTFTIIEKPGQAGLDIQASEAFFIDSSSLWKLRDLAMAMGINHGDTAVNWKEVAMECVSKTCWIFIDHQKGKDGKTYARFTDFAPNLAKLQKAGKAATEATGGVRL